MARFAVALCVASVSASALAENIALNKPVAIVAGEEYVYTVNTPPAVVTDGAFLPEATTYSTPTAIAGGIHWLTYVASSVTIEIQLGEEYTIDGIIVQADDNDALQVSYLDENGAFQPLYTVAAISVGYGFRNRPTADQVTFAPLTPVNTTTIRVTNLGGDGYYGLSELQLRGVPTFCPADYDGNGGVDGGDLAAFFVDFEAGEGRADVDRNGGVDGGDLAAFFVAFEAGGC